MTYLRNSPFIRKHTSFFVLLMTLSTGIAVSRLTPAFAQPLSTADSAVTTPTSQTLTWEDYTAFTNIPVTDITAITLHYSFAGWTRQEINLSIEKIADGYISSTGGRISSEVVDAFGNSLTQLRWSSTDKDCDSITDNYPAFRLDILFENGEHVEIRSTSNCALNIPWNVIYQDNQYVQYTGEIPTALYVLLAALPDDPFELQGRPVPSLASLEYVGDFLLVDFSQSMTGSESTATEAILYQQVLLDSDRFAPFAPFYELSGMKLFCSLHVNNPQCLNLEGELTLKSKITGDFFRVPVQVEGPTIAAIAIEELDNDLGK